jgi:hypothetical protein
MNPPFAHPAIEHFIDKLLAELAAGRVSEAVTLTNSSSDTCWFHKAADAAAALCLTKGRIRFASSERALSEQIGLSPAGTIRGELDPSCAITERVPFMSGPFII